MLLDREVEMEKKLTETVAPWLNLRIRVWREGKVVFTQDTHNVLTRAGKNWLRGRYGAAYYPPIGPVGEPPCGIQAGDDGWTLAQARGCTMNDYRIRYVGLGSGGIYNGGTFQESKYVSGLESPLPIDTAVPPRWLKQLLPQPDPSDVTTFPNSADICFHLILEETDITFAEEKTISEVALFTSMADPFVEPSISVCPTGVDGMIAYNCFSGRIKGMGDKFEILWYWR